MIKDFFKMYISNITFFNLLIFTFLVMVYNLSNSNFFYLIFDKIFYSNNWFLVQNRKPIEYKPIKIMHIYGYIYDGFYDGKYFVMNKGTIILDVKKWRYLK